MVSTEKLIALRKAKGLSQQEVAEALEVSRQAVSRWEVGKDIPSTKNLLALSRLYGVPLDTLADTAPLSDTLSQTPEDRGGTGTLARYRLLVKVLGIALATVVAIGTLVALYGSQNRSAPTEQNIVDIEDLEEERLDDADAVEDLPIS